MHPTALSSRNICVREKVRFVYSSHGSRHKISASENKSFVYKILYRAFSYLQGFLADALFPFSMHFFRFHTKAFRTGKMIQRKRACNFRFFMYTIHSVHCTALKMTMLAEGSRQLLPFSVSACTYGDRKIPQASGSTRSDIQKTG